ncbi:YidC/Oxa1 family membrane protein insertase [Peribacillus deserti]|uniref:Membrane protein insertase YidC n=1 Tax=Peribacillus deserti TaxID=673318 RepID=A0ABS2QJQ9_9BACI|nr:membrane protein insertase YidC [Peribacillus deserti]MBM7693407.1 YidC/Oxa1 family membrane protein insertase [Peribacillus deserti]
MMYKRVLSVISLLLLSLPLSGCSSKDGNAGSTLFEHIFMEPMTAAIEFFASIFHGNYGLSIICMTFIIRLILMPLSLRQIKTQTEMKRKMEAFKPELAALQKKMKSGKDPETQKQYQQEIAGLYQKHGITPLNLGCLPALIQMPILMGFYYAIKGSHHIASHSFLWFNLGHADHALAIAAGFIYYLQFRLSLKNMPEEQQKSMKFMGLMSPAMILLFSFNAPAALPLYWSIGGLFLLLQTELGRRITKKPIQLQAGNTPIK